MENQKVDRPKHSLAIDRISGEHVQNSTTILQDLFKSVLSGKHWVFPTRLKYSGADRQLHRRAEDSRIEFFEVVVFEKFIRVTHNGIEKLRHLDCVFRWIILGFSRTEIQF